MAQITGQCDTLGMKSGCLNNDGYHSMIYRGIENIFAHIWQWVDGINMISGKFYICKNHSLYASDTTENYKQLGYNALGTEGYAKELDLDVDEPFFRFPKAVGGGSNFIYVTITIIMPLQLLKEQKGLLVLVVASAMGLTMVCGIGASTVALRMRLGIGARVLIDNQI